MDIIKESMWVFPEMAYTKFMTTCMLHFLESYPESYPRIIPANHTTNHTHGFEAMFWSMQDIIMALASRDDRCFVALSLVCMSIYLPVGHVFLGMEGAKAVRQCHQNDLVHKMCIFFVLYLTKLCPSTLFLQKQSPARVIPRIIPDTYPESYPNLALLCHGPVGPFRKQPQSPAWCRREPFDIGYSLYVDSL